MQTDNRQHSHTSVCVFGRERDTRRERDRRRKRKLVVFAWSGIEETEKSEVTETVNQYQSDFVTIKQTTNGRPPEGGTRSYVVDLRGLLNRRHELILESRRSKPLMSLQVETWSCESASRWPSGH